MSTDVNEFFDDLGAGVFKEKLSHALSAVAANVVDYERGGEVIIKISMKKIGQACAVAVSHELSFTKPTMRGSVTEKDKTDTPMHVAKGGKLSFSPETQGQFFDKKGNFINPSERVNTND